MGLITYENIEDNTPATANTLNERFGDIVGVLNGGLDAANFKSGGIPVAAISSEIYAKMWPIGSVYINATSDINPGSLLGFGTWTQFAAGQVPVGIDTTQTEFNAPEKTGGTKTVSLTGNQNGVHSHGVNDPGHNHTFPRDVVVTSGSGNSRAVAGTGQQLAWSQMGGTNGNGTGISIQNSGAGEAHNNLQPYITVYMWKRTG